MVVKVYGPANAACPQRVLACLFELGLQFELVPIDLESGEQKKPEFRLRQPFGQVPAIEDGDLKLFESRAIIRYYAAKHEGIGLVGSTLEERALVEQWMEVESHNYNPLIYAMVLELIVSPRMGRVADTELVRDREGKLGEVLDVYEERLSKTKYLAGDRFTLADLTHLPSTRFLMNEGFEHLIKDRKNVYNWWIDISGRPAWKKVMLLQN
ncbi:glutathione S-transferase F12 [Primulina huaijiensis]|uniref:glutathione S-transferase F12 n=1 Tax=Primulina huaijiensis TaxID=1492673 RepID=UPI003CC75011